MVDCYTCKHKDNVVGSAHVCCRNPKMSAQTVSIVLFALLAGQTEFIPFSFERHGVVNGWCNFPLEFDPVWVKRCDWREENES